MSDQQPTLTQGTVLVGGRSLFIGLADPSLKFAAP
jgi:hypothetical protein